MKIGTKIRSLINTSFCFFLAFSLLIASPGTNAFAAVLSAQWGKAPIAAGGSTYYQRVVNDSLGRSCVTGFVIGYGDYDFGDGVSFTGGSNSRNIPFIARYGSDGTAMWAKTLTTAPNESGYLSVAVDNDDGSCYAVGYVDGTTQFNFGDGVTLTGISTNANPIIVKYGSDGTTLWARTLTSSSALNPSIILNGVSVDNSGNVYVTGNFGIGLFEFGNGITAEFASNYANGTILKYDSDGVAQSVFAIDGAPDAYQFQDIISDSDGNFYVAGFLKGSGDFDFGDGVMIEGGYEDLTSAFVVKYNSSGSAAWANIVTNNANYSVYYNLRVDTSGNVYAVGTLVGGAEYDLGNDVVAVAGYDAPEEENGFLAKYNSMGVAQWARSTITATYVNAFNGVALDSLGNCYVIAGLSGGESYDFGNGFSLDLGFEGDDISALIQYSSDGVATDVKYFPESEFGGLSTGLSGSISVVGYFSGSTFNLGNGVELQQAELETSTGYIARFGAVEEETPPEEEEETPESGNGPVPTVVYTSTNTDTDEQDSEVVDEDTEVVPVVDEDINPDQDDKTVYTDEKGDVKKSFNPSIFWKALGVIVVVFASSVFFLRGKKEN